MKRLHLLLCFILLTSFGFLITIDLGGTGQGGKAEMYQVLLNEGADKIFVHSCLLVYSFKSYMNYNQGFLLLS